MLKKKLSSRGLLKVGEIVCRPCLAVVLDHTSIALDEIDGRKALGVHELLHKFAFLVPTELVHGHAGRFSILGEFVLHALTELAPRSVHSDDGLLSALDDLKGIVVGGKVLDLTFLPQITVEGLFGASNVDSAFGLGRPILVGESNESSLTLRGVVEPGGLVSLEFEVDETGGSIFWDGDGVFGISVEKKGVGV